MAMACIYGLVGKYNSLLSIDALLLDRTAVLLKH